MTTEYAYTNPIIDALNESPLKANIEDSSCAHCRAARWMMDQENMLMLYCTMMCSILWNENGKGIHDCLFKYCEGQMEAEEIFMDE